ncbi:MAG TPA: MBL fold metallo-hydrolase [Nitrososphaera sp.]|nr:MBL fold metallo-hydrolase [Nitrososphaera sp.]
MASGELSVRINGVLPHVKEGARTSLSVFHEGFHLLVDASSGVADSIKKATLAPGDKHVPNAILITHAKREHITDLPSFVGEEAVRVYCTSECADTLARELPTLAQSSSSVVQITPGQPFEVGPFSVVAITADNSGDQPGIPGSVIYVIRAGAKKIIAGWDFLKLLNADQSVLWSPDLLVLGTETYNDHPSTGMISVSEAYATVRRWNAKLCYILHYSGEKDKEDARNQWHRGPAGPLSLAELQKTVDDHLRVTGQEGKFVIKVATEGMVWSPEGGEGYDIDNAPIGPKIEIDGLEKYVFSIEKTPEGRVALAIEDAINRLTSEFVNPKAGDNSLHADAIKSMMTKGPELQMVVSGNSVKLDITKGKKPVFAENIPVSDRDSKKLLRYIHENF